MFEEISKVSSTMVFVYKQKVNARLHHEKSTKLQKIQQNYVDVSVLCNKMKNLIKDEYFVFKHFVLYV